MGCAVADNNILSPLRLGVDFGYGYTGVCLADDANRVLGAKVIKHDPALSDLLISRRANRAMRRRAKSRRRRLRDCFALLAEMDCAPEKIEKKGDKDAERKKENPANRLYALMHRRGWDYADVLELLFDAENAKPGRKVAEVDRLLIEECAPASLSPKKPLTKNKKETPEQFAQRLESYDQSYNRAVENYGASKPPKKWEDQGDLRWLRIKRSCFEYLSDLAKEKRDLAKKDGGDDAEKLVDIRGELEREIHFWQNAKLDEMEEKIGERITAAFTDAPESLPDKKREELTGEIMAILGLADSRRRFDDGKVYRPDRNRHRSKMIGELRDLFDEVARTTAAKQQAQEIAARDGREVGDIIAAWKKRAEEIAERQYRKKRFENRKPGKCPAKIGDGGEKGDRQDEKENRCGKNLPKRGRVDIRKLLFEIEARQMNIVIAGQEKRKKPETRKLSDDEVKELFGCVKKWDAKRGEIDEGKWSAFFAERKTPSPKQEPESGEEHRGKKDALSDIVKGRQAGRTNLCKTHLAKRLELIRNDETESQEWADLHGERILDETDAPPSLRQKVDRVCAVAKRLIKAAGCEGAPIAHIGIESARFDINALSAREGRKLKNKASYSKPRGRSLSALIKAQNNLCLYCGEELGANKTVDHVFPKAGRGGDAWLNRVAACMPCNINKAHLRAVRVSPAALAALEENHPKKAAFIKKRLADGQLPPDNFAAPVQTMFGAKVLRGALAKALKNELAAGKKDGVEQFPKIRGDDVAHLRRSWFPFMARQKEALREKDRRSEAGDKLVGYVGEEFNFKKDELKKIGVLRADKILPADKKDALAAKIDDGALIVSAPGADAVGKIRIRIGGECERVYALKDGESESEFYILRDFVPEVKREAGVCAEIEDAPPREGGEIRWRRLILRAKGKAQKREATITTAACDIRLLICPRRAATKERREKLSQEEWPEDPIRKFHHFVDAAIIAANVDWEKISRLARNPQDRGRRESAVLIRQAKEAGLPDLSAIAKPRAGGDFCAPPVGDWLIVDRRDKSRPKAAKTKREPVRLRYKDGVISKRVPLDRLTRKEIERIVPGGEKIKEALRAAWKEIDALPDKERQAFVDYRGEKNEGNKCIAAAWFLQSDDFLRPNLPNAPRSVRVILDKAMQSPPFALKRGEHCHHFGREVQWEEAVLYKRGKRILLARRRPAWYVDDNNRQEWENDKRPPDADIVARFRKGDLVRVAASNNLPGLWRIKEIGKQAAIEPKDDDAYDAARENAAFIGRSKISVSYRQLAKQSRG